MSSACEDGILLNSESLLKCLCADIMVKAKKLLDLDTSKALEDLVLFVQNAQLKIVLSIP